MIYCITLIIIVALICATRLYPLWVEHDRKKIDKLWGLVRKAKEENNSLRKELKDTYDEWLKEFGERQRTQGEVFDKIIEILDKLNIKV